MLNRAPIIKSPREIDKMRVAGQMVGRVLTRMRSTAKAGMTTQDLDDIARDMMSEMKGKPLFLGYHGFPRHICTSVNQEVVHGIPGNTVLNDGDILSVDCGIGHQNYCGDSAITFPIGEIPEEVQRLLDVTRESLYAAIAQIGPGVKLREVCGAVQQVAENAGYGVVRDFVGHGIGRDMHEEPQVPNYVDPGMRNMNLILKPGYVLAIEPMVNIGSEKVRTLGDGWTVVTQDDSLSAHFEHSIAVTEDGHEVLTRREDEDFS